MDEGTIYNFAAQEDPLGVYAVSFYKKETGKEQGQFWTPSLNAKFGRTLRYHDAADLERHYKAKFAAYRADVEARSREGWPPVSTVINDMENIVMSRVKEIMDANFQK